MKRAYAGATLSHFVPKIEKTSILAKSHRPNLVWTFSGQGLRCCIHYWKKREHVFTNLDKFRQLLIISDKFGQAWTSLDQFGTNLNRFSLRKSKYYYSNSAGMFFDHYLSLKISLDKIEQVLTDFDRKNLYSSVPNRPVG